MASNKYDNIKIYKLIYKLRNDGKSWNDIKAEIKKNFNLEIPIGTISNMFTRYLSQAHVLTNSLREDKRRAKEITIDWNKKLEEKFKQIDLTQTPSWEKRSDINLNSSIYINLSIYIRF